MMTDDERKPSWFRIPHPSVLLAVGLVLVVIVVGLSVWVPYHREQEAISEIRRLGGFVYTDPGGPNWLRDLVGRKWMKCFGRAYSVNITGRPVSDAGLKQLSGLTKLRFLYLERTQVTDEGVESLQQKLPDCIIVR